MKYLRILTLLLLSAGALQAGLQTSIRTAAQAFKSKKTLDNAQKLQAAITGAGQGFGSSKYLSLNKELGIGLKENPIKWIENYIIKNTPSDDKAKIARLQKIIADGLVAAKSAASKSELTA